MALTPAEVIALVDSFDWEAYHESINEKLDKSFMQILAIQGKRGALRAGTTIAFDVDDPFVKKQLTGYVGERIVSLDATTRKEVSDLVRSIIEKDGGTTQQIGDAIAEKVREKFKDYADWRADRIARTETAIAYNYGNLLGYRQAGVKKVKVIDNDAGDADEICRKAHGQIWTIEQALANPIGHPGCKRDFEPVLEEE
jgi:SPP1 gp7 family putative phage head morphogenesis protein